MKNSSAPTPPDPTATAAAQTASNDQTAAFQQSMNLIDQNTPLGSLTYTDNGIDPNTGAPTYSSNVSLTPTGQNEFNLQQETGSALDNLALQGTSQVASAMQQPQNYSNLTALPGYNADTLNAAAPTASSADYTQAQQAYLAQETSALDPQWTQQQTQLEDQLTQQGVTEGSDAWNTAMNNFQLQKTQAYQSAQNNAITGATGVEQAQYGMANQTYQDQVANALNANSVDLSDRQEGVSEANYLRELPINEVSALLNGGQVAQPTFANTPQTSVANTNVAGITQSSFADQEQNYQTQMQQQNAAIGAVFGAAGASLGGWATDGFS